MEAPIFIVWPSTEPLVIATMESASSITIIVRTGVGLTRTMRTPCLLAVAKDHGLRVQRPPDWGSRVGPLRRPSLAGGSLGVKDRRSGVEQGSGFTSSGAGLCRPGLGWVDPDFRGTRRRLGEPAGKAFRVPCVGRGEHDRPRRRALLAHAM